MNLFPWKQALHKKGAWFSLLVMLCFTLVSVLAPWISPHDPFQWVLNKIYLPPMWVQDQSTPGEADYPLGTDRFGRDILSRLIYGTRTAFFLALIAVPLTALIGTLLGLISGFAGGRLAGVILFFTDVIHSLPGIMFVVIIILIFRSLLSPTWLNGMVTLIIGFVAISWASLTRLIRIQVLRLKAQLFVEAAVALGASPGHIITRHLLPNVLYLVLVWIINNIPAVILLEAVLGYIGVSLINATDGGEFTAVSWGGLFFAGRSALISNPLILAMPSLCLLLITMSFILLGDFLNGITRQEQD
jgi:ABC-type dipeptide/oligopeptide/nickel transport system permease subunit